jgi:predicted ABC-type ATPase
VARRRGQIVVVAGTNGAGKSAIAGEFLASQAAPYFNPDLWALKLVERGMAPDDANARAWNFGFEALKRAIANNEHFTFETTLGGTSIARELHRAIEAGLAVCVWYVGLSSPELHIARVRARVKRGGHDIPAAKIRERYPKSLANLVSFIGKAAEVHVFDNSGESSEGLPQARLVFRMRGQRVIEPDTQTLISCTPDWAKPVVAAALRAHSARGPARRKK